VEIEVLDFNWLFEKSEGKGNIYTMLDILAS